jgi:hypothetical protein
MSQLKTDENSSRAAWVKPSANRDKAREVYRLANDLLVDLVAGTHAEDFFSKIINKVNQAADIRSNQTAVVGLNRLCLFHVIMTLAKVSELYKKNKTILPSACRADFKGLVKSIDQRGILQFRNTVAGHLYDEKTKKPLSIAEVNSRVDAIMQGNPQAFFRWVNGGKDNPYPATVVSIVERARDLIRDEHKFSKHDLQ